MKWSKPELVPNRSVLVAVTCQEDREALATLEHYGVPVRCWDAKREWFMIGVPTSAELLTRTHRESGLTWDQLARYFGVSRRAVHLWAAGGRMSATSEELLAHLVLAVDRLVDLEPTARRQALLGSEQGFNIIDVERSRRSSRGNDINRSPDIGVADSEVKRVFLALDRDMIGYRSTAGKTNGFNPHPTDNRRRNRNE